MKFMGQEIENRDHLMRVFPASGGDDAWRAIKAGATTPMEVEVHAWNWKNRHHKPSALAQQQAAYRKLGNAEAKRQGVLASKRRSKAA